MRHAPDLSGIALDGRYELHALIGEGTFGRVYRGYDRRLARWVAVKVIKPWWAEDPEWVGSFEREAQLLASISDPGIVQIFDVGSAPEGPYYVAELVEGDSLAARLRSDRLSATEACDIAEQLARALARAHARRVVHRDVKPANVLISADGRIKLGDFGVARLCEGSGSDAAAATTAGTPRYMAPEQARGRAATPATDVYGVGVVLYEMLAGRPPFQGESAVELALCHLNDSPPPLPDDTPPALKRIVERALVKDPGGRYRDGAAMASALARARVSLPDLVPSAAGQLARRAGANLGAARNVIPRRPHRPDGSPKRPASPLAATKVGEPMSPRRNVNPSERRQRVGLFAAVLLLELGMVGVAIALVHGHVKVPDLRGVGKLRISTETNRLSLKPAFSSRYSQARAGTAIAQSPAPGTRVTDGSTVRVVLSAGPPPVKVPLLLGVSKSDAQTVLGGLKLSARVTEVPAPGTAVGTVTRQSPGAGASLAPGSAVTLSVAEPPELRAVTSVSGDATDRSVPFRIRGGRWEIVYSMGYEGTCTFIFFCSGPSATVSNVSNGATVDHFDLNEGSHQTRIFRSGPGDYQISISPGSDTASWAIKVDDYY